MNLRSKVAPEVEQIHCPRDVIAHTPRPEDIVSGCFVKLGPLESETLVCGAFAVSRRGCEQQLLKINCSNSRLVICSHQEQSWRFDNVLHDDPHKWDDCGSLVFGVAKNKAECRELICK